MKKVNTVYCRDNKLQFEVVDEIPKNYGIWNVSKDLIEGYIPLVQLSEHQPYPGGKHIDTKTMKAIKCEKYAEIMDNLYLRGSVEKTESYLRNKQREIERIKKSLPLIKKLKGWENIIN